MQLVSALCKETLCWSNFGQLIEDTKVRIHCLQTYYVRHTRRDVNKGAHRMAKVALSQLLDRVWLEECPPPSKALYLLCSLINNIIHLKN